MLEASAFSPAGITSFFEIRDRRPNGRPFKDLTRAGARGGGFIISRGIRTQVHLRPARKSRIRIQINGRPAPEAKTTASTVSRLLDISGEKYAVAVDHRVEVPIGAGYGASAAAALSAALALSEAADLGLSVNEAGTVAHLAEIENQTGLGGIGPLLTGGFVLSRKSGGPGIAVIDRIPVSPKIKLVSACVGPIPTKAVLRSEVLRRRINALGSATFQSITRDLRPHSFMRASRAFAYGLKLMSPQTARLMDLMNNEDAIGATQNMLGQAVHALADEDRADSILRAVRRHFPKLTVFSCDLDLAGAHIL
jgi:pantoate kinase